MNRVTTLLLGVGLAVPGLLRAGVDTAWVRRYDGPLHADDWATCLAVDSQGNVIVAGASYGLDTTLDWAIIKYGPDGESVWAQRCDFGRSNSVPRGLGADAQGNVYVTGTGSNRITTVKYSPIGQLLWSVPHGSQGGAADLALDAQGNGIVCGASLCATSDRVAIKYRPNGDTAWVRYYDWAGYEDDARALAVGPLSGIVTTGAGYDGGSGSDYVTIGYDSSGVQQWVAVYHGPADWDSPADIATDSAGNVYVTGSSEGTTSPWDYLTIKYNPQGETLWTRRYNGPADDWDQASAVAVDARGRAYVTGPSVGQGTNYDYATVAYDSFGETLWVRRYNGPADGWDQARAVAVDGRGQVCVTGTSYGGSVTYFDCATVMYDSAGETLWVRRFSSPGRSTDGGSCLMMDGVGNVYVAGAGDGYGTGSDIITIKYVQDGGVAERPAPIPANLSVRAMPNPVVSQTAVRFGLPADGLVTVQVFDVSGRVVRTLHGGLLAAGWHSVVWDGTDDRGARVPAGVYTVVLDAGGRMLRVKVVMSE
jgi:hypothetical protein